MAHPDLPINAFCSHPFLGKLKACRTGGEQLSLVDLPEHVFVPGFDRRG